MNQYASKSVILNFPLGLCHCLSKWKITSSVESVQATLQLSGIKKFQGKPKITDKPRWACDLLRLSYIYILGEKGNGDMQAKFSWQVNGDSLWKKRKKFRPGVYQSQQGWERCQCYISEPWCVGVRLQTLITNIQGKFPFIFLPSTEELNMFLVLCSPNTDQIHISIVSYH